MRPERHSWGLPPESGIGWLVSIRVLKWSHFSAFGDLSDAFEFESKTRSEGTPVTAEDDAK
jgi:hypothetical protein